MDSRIDVKILGLLTSGEERGIQGSFQTEMLEHVSILLISHLLARDHVILLHPYEGEYDLIGSKGPDF